MFVGQNHDHRSVIQIPNITMLLFNTMDWRLKCKTKTLKFTSALTIIPIKSVTKYVFTVVSVWFGINKILK